jgi:hypothetical protein
MFQHPEGTVSEAALLVTVATVGSETEIDVVSGRALAPEKEVGVAPHQPRRSLA